MLLLGRGFLATLGKPLRVLDEALRVRFELVADELAGRLRSSAIAFVMWVWGFQVVFHRGVDIFGAGNVRARADSDLAVEEACGQRGDRLGLQFSRRVRPAALAASPLKSSAVSENFRSRVIG